jgi:hypothetical protein
LESLKGGDYLEDLGLDGRIIKIALKEIEGDGVDWIHLAQDRNLWRALVNTVMNLRVL